MKKILLTVSVIMITLLSCACLMAADDISIFINGKKLITDTPPRIINGRTMVPLRDVSEAIDCTVTWFAPEKRVDVYSPYKGSLVLSLFVDSTAIKQYIYDSLTGDTLITDYFIESSPVIVNGKTFVPMRVIAEAIGFKVTWNAVTKTANLQSLKIATIEQAKDILYEKHNVKSELFYPMELDILDDNDNPCYGFVFESGDNYRYVWINAMTGEVKFADEVEDYTGEGY